MDVDIDPSTNVKTTDTIAPNVLFEIYQPQGTNANFRDEVIGGANLVNLQLRLQYRLICTPGSCGADCSQTTGCSPFPPACLPDQPVRDDSRPCDNGVNSQVYSKRGATLNTLEGNSSLLKLMQPLCMIDKQTINTKPYNYSTLQLYSHFITAWIM